MAQAALEAGLAFTNAILGATHAMSHQVGGMLDLPHGVVNGVLLPHVIRFNGAELPERFVPIAQAMGLDVAGAPPDEAVELVAEAVRALGDEVGVPRGLGALGVRARGHPRALGAHASPTRASPPTRVRRPSTTSWRCSGRRCEQTRQDHDPRTSRVTAAAQWPRRGGRTSGGPTSKRSPACARASRTTTPSTGSPPNGCGG